MTDFSARDGPNAPPVQQPAQPTQEPRASGFTGAPAPRGGDPDWLNRLVGVRLDRQTLEKARRTAKQRREHIVRVLIANGWGDRSAITRARLADTRTGHDGADVGGATAAAGRATMLRLRHAIDGLHRSAPELSARDGFWLWQTTLVVALPILLLAITGQPTLLAAIVLGLMTVVFVCAVALRVTAIALLATQQFRRRPRHLLPDAACPTYAVLIPVYREVEIAGDLVNAMAAIDYPSTRLDIVFITEAGDPATRDALAPHLLSHMRCIVVPDAAPRTKPKALNYALQDVTAEFVVIYDAEDMPDADQLRMAATRFRQCGKDLACLQARLNVYNARRWLTRQFALEYGALFDALLPCLEKLSLPLPLGGTSNHFRRSALEGVGAWDAHNVTEDADLGIRLARRGYRLSILPSTTWEEAPEALGPWFAQRTRWIKGWLQTYAVHMRQPGRLLSDLGVWRFLGLQVLAGGLLATTLVHPWVYLLLIYELAQPVPFAHVATPFGAFVWSVAAANMLAGTISAMGLAATAAAGRRRFGLLTGVATMPVYWILTSLAGYRAMAQLARERTTAIVWEKTPHRARRASETRHVVRTRTARPTADCHNSEN